MHICISLALCVSTVFGLICKSGFREVGSKCIPEQCVTEYPDGTLGECGDGGLCSLNVYNAYACACLPGLIPLDFVCYSQDCLTGTDKSNICSGHGFCRAGRCECEQNYYGLSCEHRKPVCEDGTLFAEDGCHPSNCVAKERLCSSMARRLGVCVLQPMPHCMCMKGTILLPDDLCYPLGCVQDGGPCINGHCVGTRSELNATTVTYSCVCDAGFQLIGDRCVAEACAIDTGDGFLTECSGNGMCMYNINSKAYSCKCHAPYKGIYCDLCSNTSVYLQSAARCVPLTCITYVEGSDEPVECNNTGACTLTGVASEGEEYSCQYTEEPSKGSVQR